MPNLFTDEQNAQIVLALLKAHSIRKVVASPGTTNIPITGSIQNDPYFQVYSAADERSAAYIACGLSYESGEPVVLSCTGATASRNYLPGLTEAYYRKLPVIAITSTGSLIEVGHLLPQCIDRSVSQKDTSLISVTLPPIKDSEDFWDCEIKVNKAILESKRAGGGPVHINLVTSYKRTFTTKELPVVRVIHRIGYFDPIPAISPATKVIVFIGAHKPFTQPETDALERFVETHNAVVLCDHTSSYKGAGRILSALACNQKPARLMHFENLKPELVVHLGEISGDYSTQNFIRQFNAPVWRVSEDGEIRDRFRRLEYVFEMREMDFFNRISEGRDRRDNTYLETWQEYYSHLTEIVPELPFSNTWAAQQMCGALPKNSIAHFGILNSLRNWNYFEVDESISTASNVGGFGIDGCVSALIGASLANPDKLCFGVVGDLAFFYDLSSMGNRHVGKNLRILLINNGCGVEFKLYSHFGSQFGEQTGDYIAAAGHYGNKSPNLVRHMAEDLGFKYLCANNKEEFQQAIEAFTDPNSQSKPIILECFTNAADDSTALEALDKVDTSTTPRSAAVDVAKRVLPSGMKSFLKRALKR